MFDSYVIEQKPSLRRRVLMATSIGLHVTAAVGLILYSVFHVEELAPPEVALTFFNAAPPPPPPPPPPAGGSTKKVEPKVTKVLKVPTSVTPLPKEDPTPAPKEEPESGGGEPGGVVGGVVGGVAGGVVGGVVGGVPTAAPPPPPPAAPKMVPSFVFDQQRLSSPDPHLPSEFVNRHPKQTINATYRICVNPAGQVMEVAPVRSIPDADAAIMATIRTWRWKPQPLPVCTIRNFQFKID